ncbi:M48 family metallopeptidase [Jannaschia sp. W003]|uniref:M48 family metallopeptidase n=1 Tax=Jannaschia sp. W003 TaxID=2867012 RepID=UPI0021A2B599|nr:M48 family metallopeptidase [Jannaschia sp. W003]UWQ22565.1 M48 family metallopeptidase [Jannaschia sp. W003]
MRFTLVALLVAVGLGGCVTVSTGPTPTAPAPEPARPPIVQQPAVDRVSSATAVRNFQAAVRRVEPAAESVCRDRAPGLNCDFLIRVDPDPRLPPNAFQTLDRGRPVVIFTRALIAEARNVDEIAFVVGHETAHHIEDHIGRQRQSAATGAIIGTVIGSIAGANAQVVNELGRAGAQVGARRFSKAHELEADALGTVIVARAGFDPVRGAVFFGRIPDPGDRFLGTHPPNAARIATVRRVAAGL